ncbi:MAG: riboflavin biosynthesis protein RibF [Oscillospiraceae bacterium]|nr:riboflavin biosynthesis protein RibF [Oscillospiraceae bacterium]
MNVIALGFFDGVHLGHAALLQKARQEADRLGCRAAALTFEDHPDKVIFGRKTPLINTLQEREQLMRERFGMDDVIVLPFDKDMMQMSWQAFAAMLETRFDAVSVVCGHDFTFGYRGEGNAARLKALLGDRCHVIEPVELDGETVSSTRIRELVQTGDISRANKMLGRSHFLTGTVIHGKHLGRKIGIPTANLLLPQGVVVPRFGVYASVVDGCPAVTNIGVRPTLDDGEAPTIESRLLGFDGDLYGKTIRVELLHYLRPERKFSCVEELKKQIMEDSETTSRLMQ